MTCRSRRHFRTARSSSPCMIRSGEAPAASAPGGHDTAGRHHPQCRPRDRDTDRLEHRRPADPGWQPLPFFETNKRLVLRPRQGTRIPARHSRPGPPCASSRGRRARSGLSRSPASARSTASRPGSRASCDQPPHRDCGGGAIVDAALAHPPSILIGPGEQGVKAEIEDIYKALASAVAARDVGGSRRSMPRISPISTPRPGPMGAMPASSRCCQARRRSSCCPSPNGRSPSMPAAGPPSCAA